MKIGIIGHGTDKFTFTGKIRAFALIRKILVDDIVKDLKPKPTLVSGHSPVGGIDIWSEEVSKLWNIKMDLKVPKQKTWNSTYGYKQRNLDIAKDSDELHVILVDKYPEDYKGMKFNKCYHCNSDKHIKSGACWTAKQAEKLGKKVYYHIIENY